MKNRISDFDISIGWGIRGPLSRWMFSIEGRPLSDIAKLYKRGLLGPVLKRITILGLFLELKLDTVSKSS